MRSLYNRIKNLNGYRGIILLATVLVSAAVLVAINYFTIKTTSSIRAYVAGESLYSKGQKDASRNLMLYVISQEDVYYQQFLQHIHVPLGDSIARANLTMGGSTEKIRRGFIDGNNHPDDVDNMIWLFRNFENISFMARAIQIWKEADGLIAQLFDTGQEAREHISGGTLTPIRQDHYLREINQISQKLTVQELAFSAHLGVAARRMSDILFAVNVLVILLIVGSATFLISIIIKALEDSREELRIKNKGLEDSNKKLDSFIYASSHDLKSPINNLEGLLNILSIRSETADSEEAMLRSKMKASIDKLKSTISNIENLIRFDRTEHDDIDRVSFQHMLEQIMEENEMSFLTDSTEIQTDFQVKSIVYSKLSLKSIVYNLVSNAIKYQSPQRKLQLRVSTFEDNNRTVLEVSDNGLGIDLEKYGDKLFGMFKRFHHHNTGSGLGLYAVKEIVERNNGKIFIESQVEKGSTFRIMF